STERPGGGIKPCAPTVEVVVGRVVPPGVEAVAFDADLTQAMLVEAPPTKGGGRRGTKEDSEAPGARRRQEREGIAASDRARRGRALTPGRPSEPPRAGPRATAPRRQQPYGRWPRPE